MPDFRRVQEEFEPIASRLLAADARAVSGLKGLTFLQACDAHPRDTSMAWLRRAAVATELAEIARVTPGWRDHGDTRQQGCYEFTVGGDLAVRLAADVEATPGPPATQSLFSVRNLERHHRDRVLIRLRGDALNAPVMDVALVVGENHIAGHLLMSQIARRTTTLVPAPVATVPPKSKISLPGASPRLSRRDESGGI